MRSAPRKHTARCFTDVMGAIAAIVLLATVCHARQPNIVWIVAEDMSPHLGCYGHPDAHTPNIDALAAGGIVYRNAYATAPICSPARSCLATGLYATSLGTQHLRCEVEIPDRVVPLAKRLRRLGYFCTNSGKTDYNFNPQGIWDATGEHVAPWRGRPEQRPFFSFINIGETHEGRINRRDRYDEATADLPEKLKHDPAQVTLPPFYPDTPEVRSIFAGMYNLATVFDRKVGAVIEALRADGELDNTIVFVFSDHGNGLPRYKRWLNDSGLRVPLIVSVPPKFQHLYSDDISLAQKSAGARGEKFATTDRLVSFIDFPATAISLAGGEIPDILQGKPFLGETVAEPRKYVFGARSRADDMFEVSRSVCDGRYLYVRHFLPHLPYIQQSIIFGDDKTSFRELRKLHEEGRLDRHADRLWQPRKPREELYDLEKDPHELTNLAEDPSLQGVKQTLSKELRSWILDHRDSGFLPEAEYQIRAATNGLTPFDIVQSPDHFLLADTLDAAWLVGDPTVSIDRALVGLKHAEAGVRYWSAMAIQAREELTPEERHKASQALLPLFNDSSPSVRIAVAETSLRLSPNNDSQKEGSLATLAEALRDTRPWVSLEAASTLARIGAPARPLVPVMKEVSQSNRSAPGAKRPYKDFNYASFTGWALETALGQCGEEAFVRSIASPP